MKILLKDQIKNYRFTVAKVVFLLIENRFMLIQDIIMEHIIQDKLGYKPHLEIYKKYG